MFSLIESKDEIRDAQRKLESAIQRDFNSRVTRNIGYQGGTTFDAEVFTNGTYWYLPGDYNEASISNPRRLNWFGIIAEKSSLDITVEVNTVYEGRNDRIAGFFARDNNTGSIYLMHSGRIGGGKKGVGRYTFLEWSDTYPIEVVDSKGDTKEGVLVMPIEGKAASHSATLYIDLVAKFKQAVRVGVLDTPEFLLKKKKYGDFFAEARGRRKGRRKGNFDYLSRHGEVVDALYKWRKTFKLPEKGKIVKDILIDLGVAIDNNLVEVYEVKTSASRSDIYTALGQLLVHGNSKACKRVMILPRDEPIAADLIDALKRLDIELLKFVLNEKEAVII